MSSRSRRTRKRQRRARFEAVAAKLGMTYDSWSAQRAEECRARREEETRLDRERMVENRRRILEYGTPRERFLLAFVDRMIEAADRYILTGVAE